MSRKHYTEIARALHATRPADDRSDNYNVWWESVRAIADVCESDNSRFNRDRFISACEHGV